MGTSRPTVVLLSIWLGVSLLFAALLSWAQLARNALDDPDPAYQRPGTLLPSNLVQAPMLPGGYPRRGHRLVVIFARSVSGGVLFHDLAFQSDLAALADLVLVTADGVAPAVDYGLDAIVPDPAHAIVDAYGLRLPRDGGYPIGYALVDRDGFIRHQTLDPHCIGMGHSQEMRTLLRAIP